jgi:hypothetical protein
MLPGDAAGEARERLAAAHAALSEAHRQLDGAGAGIDPFARQALTEVRTDIADLMRRIARIVVYHAAGRAG